MKIIISFYILIIAFSIYAYNYEPNRQYINPKECTETKMSYFYRGNHDFYRFKCRSSSPEVDSITFDYYEKSDNCYYNELYSNGTLLSIYSDGITVMNEDRTFILRTTSEAYGLKVSCDELYKEIKKNLKIR